MQKFWIIGLIILIVVIDYIAYKQIHKKTGTITKDNVNHPSHYNQRKLETITLIRYILTPEQFQGFLMGNVIKYLDRFKFKNGEEDLRKAQWYAKRLAQESLVLVCDYHFLDNLIRDELEFAVKDFNEYRKAVEERLNGSNQG